MYIEYNYTSILLVGLSDLYCCMTFSILSISQHLLLLSQLLLVLPWTECHLFMVTTQVDKEWQAVLTFFRMCWRDMHGGRLFLRGISTLGCGDALSLVWMVVVCSSPLLVQCIMFATMWSLIVWDSIVDIQVLLTDRVGFGAAVVGTNRWDININAVLALISKTGAVNCCSKHTDSSTTEEHFPALVFWHATFSSLEAN